MATIAQVQLIADTLAPAGTYTTVGVEPDFAKLVRSASVLIKSNGTVSYDDIRCTTPGEIHTIFLRIAAGRNANNDFLYNADDIVEMMQPTGGTSATRERYNMYGTALTWAAAKLVASHLLATIPLQSNLKFYDVAKDLKAQAIEDIERIIKLLDNDTAVVEADTSTEQGQVTLYIAHDLDLNTIPESSFNIPDPNTTPPTYEGVVDLGESVSIYRGVEIPTGFTGVCYLYMTGQAIDADKDVILSSAGVRDSSSVSFKIEDAFEVAHGTNIDTLITLISDAINIKTLEALPSTAIGNILVGPERGQDLIQTQSAVKKLLYPDTGNLHNRTTSFELCYRVNRLNFQVRRLSSKVSSELLTIMFYTVPTTAWQNYTNGGTVGTLRQEGTLGIKGLIFGQQSSYGTLGSTSPFSVLLNVEKGNVIPVSIQDDPGSNTIADDLASDGTLLPIDTFYFHGENTHTGFTKNLRLRVLSTEYNNPANLLIEVDLMNPPILPMINAGTGGNDWTPPNCIGEEVARRVTEAVYNYTRITHTDINEENDTNVLAVNLGEYNYQYLNINQTSGTAEEINLRPDNASTTEVEYRMDFDAGRVQIVGFKYRSKEFKIVVDIIQIPPELYIATGNYRNRRTNWVKGKPRSITIDTKVLNPLSDTVAETISQQLNSVKASVSQAPATRSPLLQSVYDKRKLLRESLKGFPNTWQYKN